MTTTRRPSATARLVLTALGVRPVLAVLAAVSCGIALCSCAHQSRSSFAEDADSACRQSVRMIAHIQPIVRSSPRAWAIDYFTAYDRLIAQLGDMQLPAGQEDQIRAGWIAPARADLQALRPKLARLPAAQAPGHPAETGAVLTALRTIGTRDVDPVYLRSLGVRDCVPMFTGRA